jgi:clan AA aspartic protease (TIGR02281 family)
MFEIALSKELNTIFLLDVRLQGPSDFADVDMILDTDAAYCMISWNVASSLGYQPDKGKTISILTANGYIQAPVVTLSKIIVHDVVVNSVPVICHDILGSVEVRGILGLNFLKHVRTVVDYRALRLEIS